MVKPSILHTRWTKDGSSLFALYRLAPSLDIAVRLALSFLTSISVAQRCSRSGCVIFSYPIPGSRSTSLTIALALPSSPRR